MKLDVYLHDIVKKSLMVSHIWTIFVIVSWRPLLFDRVKFFFRAMPINQRFISTCIDN